MKKLLITLLTSTLLLASQAQAFSEADQYNIGQLVNGGAISIRNAAKKPLPLSGNQYRNFGCISRSAATKLSTGRSQQH